MSFWQMVGDSAVGASVMVLAVGLALLVLFACLAEWCVSAPLWRRFWWRGIAVFGGIWVALEVAGGNAMVAGWIHARAASSGDLPPAPQVEADSPPQGDAQPQPLTSFDLSQEAASYDVAVGSDDRGVLSLPVGEKPLAAAAGRPTSSGREEGDRVSEGDSAALAPRHVTATWDSISAGGPQPPSRARLTSPADLAEFVAYAWLAGCAVMTTWFVALRIVVAWFSWRHTSPAIDDFAAQVAEVAEYFENPSYRIVQSSRLSAPVVYGVLRPTLAVPCGFAELLPPLQRQAVLAHEFVHLSGRDPLWQTIFDVLATLVWWHPCVWLARDRHRSSCEAAADCGAAVAPGGSRALAAALVRLGRELATRPRIGWAALDASSQRRSRFAKRVLRLLNNHPDASRLAPTRRGRALGVVSVVILVTVMFFGTALARSDVVVSTTQDGGKPMATWRTFWRSSLAASALMTMIGATAADRAEAAGEPVAGAGAVEAEVVSEEADARGLDLEIDLDPQAAFAFADDVSDEEAFREADDRPIDEQEAGAKLLDLARVKQRIAALAEREEAVAAEQLAKIQMELARTKERLAKEQAQLSQQVQALMEQVQSEAEQARHGLAEQVAKRVQQMRQLQVDDPFTLDATDEASGRADHLLQAAEELRAIGKTELADKLMEEAKRAAAADSTARPGGPAHPPMPTRPQAAPGAPEPPPRPRAEGTLRFEVRPPGVEGIEAQAPHFDQEIHEEAVDLPAPEVERLREEMNELRSQVNDMREMLKRVVNRLERDQTAEQVK